MPETSAPAARNSDASRPRTTSETSVPAARNSDASRPRTTSETSMLPFLHVVSLQYIVLFSTLSVFPFFYEKNKKYSKKHSQNVTIYALGSGHLIFEILEIFHQKSIILCIYIAFGRWSPYLWKIWKFSEKIAKTLLYKHLGVFTLSLGLVRRRDLCWFSYFFNYIDWLNDWWLLYVKCLK